MRLFLDTSVLLAAAGSSKGASRFIVSEAKAQGWELISSDYCEEETLRNLPKLRRLSSSIWKTRIAPHLRFVRTNVALDKPLVFPKAKDRPVVITALACRADWLLTLDETDFHGKLGREVYGLKIATPGEYLMAQRNLGLL